MAVKDDQRSNTGFHLGLVWTFIKSAPELSDGSADSGFIGAICPIVSNLCHKAVLCLELGIVIDFKGYSCDNGQVQRSIRPRIHRHRIRSTCFVWGSRGSVPRAGQRENRFLVRSPQSIQTATGLSE
uniref:Uncharacterized protein n=1 Tax=Strigamia maritima TaxID=126957 RepID=T1JAQ8_STRMM